MKVQIRKHEVGLWFRRGNFVRLLQPGAYLLPGRLFGFDMVQVVNTMRSQVEHPLLDLLIQDQKFLAHVEVVDLLDGERAIVRRDGRYCYLLGAGRHVFWKQPYRIEVEKYSISEGLQFTHSQMDAVLRLSGADQLLFSLLVDSYEQVLVFQSGELVQTLGPGRHVLWRVGNLTWKQVDLREQACDVSGQEIMTADKLTLRVNLLVTFQVTDPVLALTKVSDFSQALYRTAQLALRDAVGVRSLEKLLADKDQVAAEIEASIAGRASEFGLTVRSAGVRDVILPGEMKDILNQVLEAQKQAEANLIRRREETAAARSQANTAKLLADNPVLLRMKELEALQEILRGSSSTFVLGQGDLLQQVQGLAGLEKKE